MLRALFVFSTVLLAGCSASVNRETFDKIRRGMTGDEVRSLLGSGKEIAENSEDDLRGAEKYLRWESDRQRITVGLRDGKVVYKKWWYQTNPPPAWPQTAEVKIDDEWEELFLALINCRADNNRTPGSLEEVERMYPGDPSRFDGVRTGRIVVRWGCPPTDLVFAYEKDAPERGGVVLQHGRVERWSAEKAKTYIPK
jgi:hypothetical protein